MLDGLAAATQQAMFLYLPLAPMHIFSKNASTILKFQKKLLKQLVTSINRS